MQEWPKLYLESLQPGCPFDPPARASQKGKRSSKGQRSSQSASTQRQKVQVETARATGHFSSSKKAGYCELCNINYRGIKHHLKGKRHLENAANSNAFQELDAEIREGRSPNGYLKSFKQQRTPKKLTIKRFEVCNDSILHFTTSNSNNNFLTVFCWGIWSLREKRLL